MKKILAAILRIVLIIFLLEAGLRISGYARVLYQEKLNRIVPEQRGAYIILVIGDSMTYGDGASWSLMLEGKLNSASEKTSFNVIVEAQPAYTSSYLLSKMEGYLSVYNPDMVVAMIGINDPPGRRNEGQENELMARRLRVYRLLNYYWSALDKRTNEIYSDHIKTFINEKDGITNPEFGVSEEGRIMKMIEQNPENESLYNDLAENYAYLHGPNDAKDASKDSTSYMDKFDNIAWYYLNNNRIADAQNLFDVLEQISPNRLVTAYTRIGHTYTSQGRNEEAKNIYDRADNIRKEYYNPTTQQNYQKLHGTLKERNIRLIAVQYPTLSVKELEVLFQGDENIKFVSNEENFNEILMKSNYEQVFKDRDHGTFGHLAQAGANLLADNVADAVLKNI